MSRINRPGAGGPGPIGNPEPAENLKETSAAKESANTKTSSSAAESASTIPRPVAGDKNVAADLKATGSILKSELHKALNTMKTPDAAKEKEMAQQLAQNMPRFAPPYVPVGPVVGGDNIGVPGQTPEQIASQKMPRFAPPYVPVGPVVGGDNIGVPGQTPAGGQMNELNLRADQFQINDQGNLVITNQKLIDFFKTLKEGGEDVRLGFMKMMKPPGEE